MDTERVDVGRNRGHGCYFDPLNSKNSCGFGVPSATETDFPGRSRNKTCW